MSANRKYLIQRLAKKTGVPFDEIVRREQSEPLAAIAIQLYGMQAELQKAA